MIGQIITEPKTGIPLTNSGGKLSESAYQPSSEVRELFARVQRDYQVGWLLQHRPFDEFDGMSLLDRTRLDTQTFGAYVGAEYVPAHKKWRWKGRKNTARNKLIKLLSRAISGMLYPYVYAKNDANEEDKMTARVMRILIEDSLRKAGYKTKFLYMALSALVNPAVIVCVEYVEVMQKVKQKVAGGKVKITEIVDELLSGLAVNTVPIDEMFFPDFFSGTGKLQHLPNLIRVRRISYDQARGENAGKYFDENGEDYFKYVTAGQTRFMGGEQGSTLYDVPWTEADANFVQEITAYYRSEDLEVKWVGGVGMFDHKDPYNSNPFKHRRMTLFKGQWYSMPVYPYAMSGFEPIDPSGRFLFFKSGAFKEYWDDAALNHMHKLAMDGTYLDVIKPIFLSGVTKVDATVMIPGATVGMPQGATATPYQLGPNLAATYNAMAKQSSDLSESTSSDPVPEIPTPGVPATQTNAAVQQAKMFFTVFALLIADLVEQVGALTMDCTVQHATMGELDNTVPEALKMKYKTYLSKGKDKGKDVTHRIEFTDQYMGKQMTKAQVDGIEWDLYDKTGGEGSDQRIYLLNPYQFARTSYTMYVDSDKIVLKSLGADRVEKVGNFNMLSDPRVAPFTDRKAVADDIIEEFGGDDPERFKLKGAQDAMLNQMMMGGGAPAVPGMPGAQVEAPGLPVK